MVTFTYFAISLFAAHTQDLIIKRNYFWKVLESREREKERRIWYSRRNSNFFLLVLLKFSASLTFLFLKDQETKATYNDAEYIQYANDIVICSALMFTFVFCFGFKFAVVIRKFNFVVVVDHPTRYPSAV